MNEEIILPEGYKQVSYIQCNGKEYFNTDYIPTNNTGYKAEFDASPDDTRKLGFFLGVNNGSTWTTASGIYFSGHYYPFYGWGGSKQAANAHTYFGNKIIAYLNYMNDRKCYYNIAGSDYPTSTLADLTFTPEYPIYVGTINLKNSSVTYPFYGRIFRVTITENDEIVRDYIPCLDSDGVPCFYDIIEGGTYYNIGTGKFMVTSTYFHNYNYSLPEGYKKCTYLQSNGTQYINTSIYKDPDGNNEISTVPGIIPTDETGLYLKSYSFSYDNGLPFATGNSSSIISVPKIATSTEKGEYYWNSAVIFLSGYDKGDDLAYSSTLNLYNDRTVHYNSEDIDWDGKLSSTLSTQTYPLYLFGYNESGTLSSTYAFSGRIYRAKITQGTDLIRDFVPCLDADGIPCMYDLIGGGTYYNQGEGEDFEYCLEHKLPSDFMKLKYLESTGTQYINTNYVPQVTDNGDGTYTATTGLYIDAYNITVSDSIPMGCRTTSSTNTRFFTHRLLSATYNPGYGWGAWTQVSTIRGKVAYQSKLNFLNDKKAVIEAPKFSTITNTLGNLSFQPTLPIYMFGINVGNALKHSWKGRIYRAKISEGDEIVRDYIPAYDSRLTRPCMYDIINGVAYYSESEDEFLYDRQYEGTYTGFTQMGGIGNRVGGLFEDAPSDYIKAYFLQSDDTTGKIIDTGIKATGDLKITIDVEALGWNYVNYIFGSVNAGSNNIVFSMNYNNAHGSSGLFRYGSGYGRCNYNFNALNTKYNYVFDKNIIYRDGIKVNLTKISETFPDNAEEFESSYPITLFGAYHDNGSLPRSLNKRIWNFKIERNNEKIFEYVPVIDNFGVPCVYDKVSKQTIYGTSPSSSVEFIVGLTKYQARELYKLPHTSGGTLTISLPEDIIDSDGNITDNLVKTAKEKAEEKGWNFIIQTYSD